MSEGFFKTQDGCVLAFVDEGVGMPVLWQHGLGADRTQPADVFPAMEGVRRITLECRGHGLSELGDIANISVQQFADDAKALLDHLKIERAVVGGISLGAAIALRLAAFSPEQVHGLILARPAWVDEEGPDHLRIYADVAQLLEQHGPTEGALRFEESTRLPEVEAISLDNAASMRGFFERRDLASTIALLSRIPAQGPGVSRRQIRALDMPVVIIANGEDYVHSLDTARELNKLISGSQLRVITSKTLSRTRYTEEFRQALCLFLAPLRNAQ